MSSRKVDIALGIVFFGALIGLGVITIVLSDFALGVERHEVELLSNDVGYLRPGDPLLLHGMSSGKVVGIERLEDPVTLPPPGRGRVLEELVTFTVRIHAVMDVDPYRYLRADYEVLIEERGLLGGKLIRIEPGSSGEPVPAGPLLALSSRSVVQAASEILEDNRVNIQRTIQNLADMVSDANAGEGTVGLLMRDEKLASQVRGFVDDAATVSDRLVRGEGTVGRLLSDSQLYDDARASASDVRSIVERVKRGEGTVGRLLGDDAVYRDIAATTSDVRTLVSDTLAGRGTLGRLVTDERLYENSNATTENLAAITADARAGHGTVGRLLVDETLYENAATFFGTDLQGAADDLESLLADVTDGQGLIPTLIHDKALADNFRDILGQTLGAIEDARETTPVQSLGSFLFGTF